MTIEWVRDAFYTTRAKEKVRLICTDAGETWPLIFFGDGVGVFRHPPSGFRASSEFDIIGPWVEPVKPLECWANDFGGEFCLFLSEKEAHAYGRGALRVAVHMREVLP